MKELETLLTSLIQRGRKPWGLRYFVDVLVSRTIVSFATAKWASSPSSLRELVSLESWLWQFIVENKLYKPTNNKYEVYYNYKRDWYNFIDCRHLNYRLLESAIIPENEIGKFLIENIKVE